MGIETVYTCDCCGATLASSSILDCIILTTMIPDSQVTQIYFGIACGCAAGIHDAITVSEGKHKSTHKAPDPVSAPAPA